MRYVARAALLLAVAGAALAARPAAALDLELTSVSVAPVTAKPGDVVTVSARVKRSDPPRPNPPGPVVVTVSFLRTGEAKPFATRQVRLAANATADVFTPWKATPGRHQFSVRITLAPNQKLPTGSNLRDDTRTAGEEVVVAVVTATPPSDSRQPAQTTRTQGQPPPQQQQQEQQQKPEQAQSQSQSTQQGSGQTQSPQGSSPGSPPPPPPSAASGASAPSTVGGPFRPIELTTSGIRLAGGPLPAPGAGTTTAAPTFRPVTLTTAGMRLVGGALPARDPGTPAAASFRPVTITTPPMSVRGR